MTSTGITISRQAQILAEVESGACRFVDLQFTDVTGALKSVVLPSHQLAETFEYGHWFDGSALEGAARALETDLLLRPDPSTWALLPWPSPGGHLTARLLCDVRTPDGTPYPADPRGVLARAVQDAADLSYDYHVAAEVEFFLFRRPAGAGGPAPAAALAASPSDRSGYFDLAPQGNTRFRDEVVRSLEALGVHVEASHHEIGPGQHEIDLPLMPAMLTADAIATCKYVVKTVARRHALAATFMPKPLEHAAGSGMHLGQVLVSGGANAFATPLDEHGLSPVGRAFIAGQLAHARAICAVLAPSVNSYKRLGRGFDAPAAISWGYADPLSVIRVPRAPLRRYAPRTTSATPAATAALPAGQSSAGGDQSSPLPDAATYAELRCPDPSCNPYLALAVALAAGLDGVRRRLDLPPASDALAGARAVDDGVAVLPVSLGEALQELQWDPVVRDALGAPVFERLLVAQEAEWQAYRRHVSAWEVERYFESA